jgi:very-short-patch-repair endonuclease
MKPIRRNKTIEARDRAGDLRSNMSVAEQWFWGAVRKDQLGYRVRRQVTMGPYILDFYVPSAKLCIEVDGEQHSASVEKDQQRDAYLGERGILTVRIPSLDFFGKDQDLFSKWIQEIQDLCNLRASSPPPTPSSRALDSGPNGGELRLNR